MCCTLHDSKAPSIQEDTGAAATAQQLVADEDKEVAKAAAKKAKKQKAKAKKQQAQSNTTAAAELAGSTDKESSSNSLQPGSSAAAAQQESKLTNAMSQLHISKHELDQTPGVPHPAALQPQSMVHVSGEREEGLGTGTDACREGDEEFLDQLSCCPITKVHLV